MALVVYDFGGGTFDTSILRRRPDYGWEVLVSDGLNDVGGVDLDAAIIAHLERNLGAHDPEMWHRLTEPVDDNARRRHRMLWEEVRAAKEQLSRSSSAGVHVPLFDTDVYLTREEFERVARPYLERTVDLAANALQRAGVRHDQIAGLFPVGGSSRIPLVNTLLHHRLGVAPTLIEQPELVVALGSVLALGPTPGSAQGTGYPSGAVRQPMSAGPVPPPGPPPAWGPPGSPSAPPGFGSPAGPRVGPGVGAGAGLAAAAGLGAAASAGFGSPAAASVSPTASPVSGPASGPVSGPGAGPVSVPPTSSSVSPAYGATGPVSAPPGSTSDSTGAFATEPVTAALGAEAPPSGLYPPPPPVGSGYSSAPLGPPRRSGGGSKMGLIAGVVVVALLLVGGGTALAWKVVSNASKNSARSGNNSSTNSNTGNGSGSTTGNKDAQGAGKKQHAVVNKSAWYANFKLTFGAIDYDPAEEIMTAEILVENQGSENKAPGVDMTFSVGDKHYDGGPKDSINVDAGQKSNVVFEFRMNDFSANINDGLFTIGDSKTAQATVPVTDKGDLVAYEPKNLVKDKMVTDRDLNIWFTTCDLRGGFFNYKGQADKGYLAITCSVDMQYTGGSAGGHYVGADNFALGLPDGTEVGPTVAPNEALYSAERVPNTQLGFQVKAPVKGTYKLRVVDVHAGKTRSNADVAEVPITIS
jgi:hypothetical protein